jgi:hypothetical protein
MKSADEFWLRRDFAIRIWTGSPIPVDVTPNTSGQRLLHLTFSASSISESQSVRVFTGVRLPWTHSKPALALA